MSSCRLDRGKQTLVVATVGCDGDILSMLLQQQKQQQQQQLVIMIMITMIIIIMMSKLL